MEGDVIALQDIFLYDTSAGFDENGKAMGTLKSTGLRPKFLEKMANNAVTVDPMTFATDGTAMNRPRSGAHLEEALVAVAAAALLSGALDRRRRHRVRGRHRLPSTTSSSTASGSRCSSRCPARTGSTSPWLGADRRQGRRRPTAENAADSDLRRTSVLAFDTSNSMAGAKFTQAKAAALELPRRGARQRLRRHRHLRRLGRRRPRADPEPRRRCAPRSAVSSSPSPRALNQGVIKAVDHHRRPAAQRNVLVLSDGLDTTRTPLSSVSARSRTPGQGRRRRAAAVRHGARPAGADRQAGKGPCISAATRPRSRRRSRTRPSRSRARCCSRPRCRRARRPTANVAVSLEAGGTTYSDHAFTTIREKAARANAPAEVGPVAAPHLGPQADHADAGRSPGRPSASVCSGSCSR